MGEGVPNYMDRELHGLQTRLGSLRMSLKITFRIYLQQPLLNCIVDNSVFLLYTY